MRTNLLTALIIIVGIISPLMILRYIYHIRKCTIKVPAVVVSIEIRGSMQSRRHRLYYPTYRYKVGHWWYTAQSSVAFPYWYDKPKLKVGEKKDIWVCKSNHKFCIPDEYKHLKNGPADAMFGIFGAIICISILICKN